MFTSGRLLATYPSVDIEMILASKEAHDVESQNGEEDAQADGRPEYAQCHTYYCAQCSNRKLLLSGVQSRQFIEMEEGPSSKSWPALPACDSAPSPIVSPCR